MHRRRFGVGSGEVREAEVVSQADAVAAGQWEGVVFSAVVACDIELRVLSRGRVEKDFLVAAANGDLAAGVGLVKDDEEVGDAGRVVELAGMVSTNT